MKEREPEVMPEVLIGQRYRLTEKIGGGGMADVYRAVDETLGRNVAVKVMHERYASDPTFTARFRQEAQAAANLSSPYIVNIYDWGQENNTYYIVMELVRGTDLKTVIRERGPLPSKEVAEIGAQVCSALATAHGYDVIHRDIKPHNIMITADHNVKVMDFGIARAGNTTLTQTGSVLGSAHYVSPEQAQGRQLTPASDLYSLGVVLYEAATGQMPFDGDTPIATALKQVNEQAVRPSRINPQIDPNLELVIGYAMAKDPRARYATASTMRADLIRIVRDEPILGAAAVAGAATAPGAAGIGNSDQTQLLDRVTPAATPASTDTTGNTTVMPQVGGAAAAAAAGAAQPAKKKRRAWIWILLVVLLVAGVLVGGYLLGWFGGARSQVRVPNLRGSTVATATQLLKDQNLKLGRQDTAYSPTIPKDQIISQNPRANARVDRESAVNVVVSLGQDLREVPDVRKMDQASAKKKLEDAGFKVETGDPKNSPDVPSGQVMSQDPAPKTKAPAGSTVTIVISLGQEMGTVPDVTNMSRSQAITTLTNAGFPNPKVDTEGGYSDTVSTVGNVVRQSIQGNTRTPKGTIVTITLSQGPLTLTVPNITGQSQAQAQATLRNAGFSNTTIQQEFSSTVPSGNAIGASPASGTTANRNATITIIISQGPPSPAPTTP
ncbi:MAG: Stk1 family PASTA domain-containing Ser/Thr kinase [Actinomycetia bacterium]|nr:Stk1 family PASTA domain-containing Ser/Thr kinase [Actinomycetes bacterium]